MRRILRGTLILVIPSFVVFYGWSQLDQAGGEAARSFAKITEPSILPFWPFAKSEPVTAYEMVLAGESLTFKTQMAYNMAGIPLPQARPGEMFTNGEILREAVNLRILHDYAQKMGIYITDAQIKDIVSKQMPWMAQRDYREAYLQQMGQDEQQFLNNLRNQLLYTRVLGTFMNKSKVSLFELWQEYTLQKEKVELDFVRIPSDRFKSGVAIDEEAMKKFFEENLADYRIPDQRVYEYVSVSREGLEQQTQITDADVRAFYDQNQVLFQTPRRVKVRQIKLAFADPDNPVVSPEMMEKMNGLLEQVKAPGANFEQVANDAALETMIGDEASTESLSIQTGELGWVGPDEESQYGKELVDAASALAKADDVSEVVRSSEGLHILQAIEFEEPKVKPYEGEVIEQARTQVRAQKISKAMDEWTQKIQDAAKDAPTVSELAKAVGLEVKTSALLHATEIIIDPAVGSLGSDQDYLAMLERGDKVAVLTTSQGIIALQIEKEVPAHDPELAEVRAQVEDDYRSEKALEQAKALADSAMETAKNLETLQDWAEQQGLRVETTAPFERMASPAEITETIDGLANLTYKTPVGAVRQSTLLMQGEPTGYIVLRIRSIQPPTREQFTQDYYDFQRELVFLKQWALMEEWLTEARKDWKIERKIGPEA